MNKFSIKEVEAYTGIKAHTLRIWEQRYAIVEPKRTDTNIRYYDSEDLRKLLNISFLNQNGYKISKLALCTDKELQGLVREKSHFKNGACSYSDSLKLGMLSFDKDLIDSAIDDYQKMHGLERTVEDLIFPFVAQIGTLWLTNLIDPCHEHFISTIIRNRLAAATRSAEQSFKGNGHRVLLFLPDGEWHEMGLQYLHYKLLNQGFKVCNLGQSVPVKHMGNVLHRFQPHLCITSITGAAVASEFQNTLKEILPDLKQLGADLWASIHVQEEMPQAPHSQVRYFENLKELSENVQENLLMVKQ